MASDARVALVDGADTMVEDARLHLELLERRWSRFDPDSELSRLNRSESGRPITVSPDTLELVRRMRDGAIATGGAYDPTMLAVLVTAGYDRSHELGLGDQSGGQPGIPVVVVPSLPASGRSLPTGGPAVAGAVIDLDAELITMPPGVALDPGGIGKGLAADLVVEGLLARGAAGAMVSIGGDLVVAGRPPAGGWVVAVEDVDRPDRDLARFRIDGGGVATSSTLTRRWRRAGRPCHHVLDPRSGTVSTTDLVAVTVIAPTGWLAEVHATAALLAGSGGVLTHLGRHRLSGLAVTADGDRLATADLAALLDGSAGAAAPAPGSGPTAAGVAP
jgi:thiamine biosynthesis lipoprotein